MWIKIGIAGCNAVGVAGMSIVGQMPGVGTRASKPLIFTLLPLVNSDQSFVACSINWLFARARRPSVGFLAGYDSGVAGGILSFSSFQKSFGYSEDDITKVQALTVSLRVLGCFLSCFVASFIVEKYGRKRSITGFAVVFIIGVVIQVSPTDNLGAWYFARVWAGLGQGSLTVAVPIYTAEMAPPAIRGRLGSLYQWMVSLVQGLALFQRYQV